jgi:sialate O-acetylesterase
MKLAYGKNIVADGPVYQSMKVDGNKIVLTFKKEPMILLRLQN